jgi:predicted transcriptional regulator
MDDGSISSSLSLDYATVSRILQRLVAIEYEVLVSRSRVYLESILVSS